MVAVFIHLDDTSMENGGLAVYPGSHHLGPLEDRGNIPGKFDVKYCYGLSYQIGLLNLYLLCSIKILRLALCRSSE